MNPATSPAAVAANRANAHLSTGPQTSAGKAKSSLNAVKTGLTGRTVLLPSDDAAAYESHVQRFMKDLKPIGPREHELVQALADNSWRVERIFSLEMAIFAKGRSQFAARFEHEDPANRPGLVELETYLFYEKQLRNLSIQESRLRRQREKDAAALRELQENRKRAEKAAKQLSKPAPRLGSFLQPAEIRREELDCDTAPAVHSGPEFSRKDAAA